MKTKPSLLLLLALGALLVTLVLIINGVAQALKSWLEQRRG